MNISDLIPIESSSSTTYLGFPRTTIKIVGQHCFKFNFAILHQSRILRMRRVKQASEDKREMHKF